MSGDVKERSAPVPCRGCGRPTRSPSGRCYPCRSQTPAAAVTPPPPVTPPPVAAAPPEAALDEHGRLLEDRPCRHCGYNLRHLSRDAACPECSTPVARSIRSERLRFCDPAWVGRLARGVRVALLGTLASVAVTIVGMAVAILLFGAGPTGPGVAAAFAAVAALGVACSAVTVAGCWLLTTPEPGGAADEKTLSLRRLARFGVMADLVAAPLQMLDPTGAALGARGVTGFPWLMLAATVLGLVAVVGVVAGLLYLERLARRLPRPGLAKQTRVVAIGFACGQGATLGAGLAFIGSFTGALGAGNPGATAGLLVVSMGFCAGALAGLVFGVWALVLLFLHASALRQAAEEARDLWDGAPG